MANVVHSKPSITKEIKQRLKASCNMADVTNKVEGADQGSPFNTSRHDSQPIIHEGMGGGDH